MQLIFAIALALVGAWYYRRIRAVADVPALMRVLWSAGDPSGRCIWPRRRSEPRLFLDWPGVTEGRARRAARAAWRMGLVRRDVGRRETLVGIDPELIGLGWSEESGWHWKDSVNHPNESRLRLLAGTPKLHAIDDGAGKWRLTKY